jgi:eukaryotic-like serine/threonine-protein kinase
MAGARGSLTARIFLSSAGIVVLVMAATLFLTQRSATAAAETSIGRSLSTSEARVRELLGAERGVLAGRLQSYADSPELRGNLDEDPPQYLDYVETAAQQSGARWVQFIGRDGMRYAKSDDRGAPVVDVTGSPLVTRALDGQVSVGFGIAGDTSLVQYVAVPIRGANNRILGALMAPIYVSDSLARALYTQTRSDVLFFRFDTLGQPQLAASSEKFRAASPGILRTLADRLAADTDGVQLASGRDSASATDEFDIDGDHIVATRALVTNAAGGPVGGFLTMRSRDDELRESGYTTLRNTLLYSGAGGFALALLMGFVTSRQVVRPVRKLAEATRRAAEGDYAAQIPEGGTDEIGTLSSAFRRLLSDLREKQAVVDFLSSTVPGTREMIARAGVTATLQIPVGGGMQVLSPGQTFGNRYEIKSVLGVGGMGMVYKANDRELGEVLAIKTLRPEMVATDSSALERFKSEIRLARRIAHRNVVRTYDLGEASGQYYITMEYVEGKSLKDLIREHGRLPATAVLPIAKQLCRALAVSHEEGIIHRDIKPQNMVVQGDGVLKVMDFGIARLASRPADTGHTQAGMVVGTPEYMAPEQLLGDELDARADLYATGVVLYECLVGKVPHTADTPMTLIAKVLEEVPRPPVTVQADIPQQLSELVMWAMAKDREQRPRSAAELLTRLDEINLT